MKRIIAVAVAGISQFALAGGSVNLKCTNYQGAEALVDFPLLVRLSSELIPRFSYDGLTSDLISFKDAEGNELPCDVDTWNPDGESLVWVKVPSLTKTTKVTLCWGEARTTSATNVWSAYRAVYHFDGDPQYTRQHSKNAEMNDPNDLWVEINKPYATQASVDSVLGKGFQLTRKGSGTGTMLEVFSTKRIGLQQGGAVTVSGWWRLDQLRTASETYPRLFAFGGWSFGGFYLQCGDNQGNNTFTCEVVEKVSTSNYHLALGDDSTEVLGGPSLHHVAVAFRGGEQRVYVDGELKASGSYGMVPFTTGPFALVDGVNKATVDEVRLQLVAASEDWIKADYRQQASAEGCLYTVVNPGLLIMIK